MVVYFIKDVTSGSLEKIREDVFENTKELLRLFDERRHLSRRISAVKSRGNLDIRDREREIRVLKMMPDLGPVQRSILNMIFEYTIWCESKDESPDHEEMQPEPFILNGSPEILEYFASTICCSPGSEVYASGELNENFKLGAAKKGAHIINGTCDSVDFRIGHTDELGEYDIALSDKGVIKIRTGVIQSEGIYMKVQVD